MEHTKTWRGILNERVTDAQRDIDALNNLIALHRLSDSDANVKKLVEVAAAQINRRRHEIARAEIADALQALETGLRKVRDAGAPDEQSALGARNRLGELWSHAGWTSGEGDIALLLAGGDALRISNLDWSGCQIDGKFVSRVEIRNRMRSSAYSDQGWREYLSGLPKIEAPEKPIND